jgi:hypothetical protein
MKTTRLYKSNPAVIYDVETTRMICKLIEALRPGGTKNKENVVDYLARIINRLERAGNVDMTRIELTFEYINSNELNAFTAKRSSQALNSFLQNWINDDKAAGLLSELKYRNLVTYKGLWVINEE